VRTKLVCGTEEKDGVDGEREAREFLFFCNLHPYWHNNVGIKR